MTKETIIKSALKNLVKMQIKEGSVGFAVDNDPDHDVCWDDVLAWLEAQPCRNCISRESVIEWLKDKDIIKTKDQEENARRELAELPSVTPRMNLAETSQDCISIQAVDDAIYDYSRSCDVNYEQIMEFIDKLPSVIPQRKRGKWNFIGDQMFECSSCKRIYTQNQFEELRIYTTDDLLPKFCPNCGSYNGGGEDEQGT